MARLRSRRQPKRNGLTSAAAIWIAAACGVAASAGMTQIAIIGSFLTAAISRWLRLDDDLTWVRPLDRDQDRRDDVVNNNSD